MGKRQRYWTTNEYPQGINWQDKKHLELWDDPENPEKWSHPQETSLNYGTLGADGNFVRESTCRLQCMQCKALLNDGSRCLRKTCVSLPYCNQHLQKIAHIRLSPSKVDPSKMGLFVTYERDNKGHRKEVVFPKNHVILTIPLDAQTRPYSGNTDPYTYDGKSYACTRYAAINVTQSSEFTNSRLQREGNEYQLVALIELRSGDEVVAEQFNYWNPTDGTPITSRRVPLLDPYNDPNRTFWDTGMRTYHVPGDIESDGVPQWSRKSKRN